MCIYTLPLARILFYLFIYYFIYLFIYLFIFVVAALPQVLSLRVYGIRIFIERKKHARTDDYYTQLLITQLEWKIFFFVLLYFQRSHSCFFFLSPFQFIYFIDLFFFFFSLTRIPQFYNLLFLSRSVLLYSHSIGFSQNVADRFTDHSRFLTSRRKITRIYLMYMYNILCIYL